MTANSDELTAEQQLGNARSGETGYSQAVSDLGEPKRGMQGLATLRERMGAGGPSGSVTTAANKIRVTTGDST